jgi:tRNA threonylcarbamoyladenosine biosynthesis protein TsaE
MRPDTVEAPARETPMVLSEEELERWGERIGSSVRAPVFLMLRGPVGAGKSVLARAVARGAGVRGTVPSPTFNLVFRHPGVAGRTIVHMDLYRVRDESELVELGWDELGDKGEIVIVEWPERAGSVLPQDRWEISLHSPVSGATVRAVEVLRSGRPPELPPR